MEYNCMIICLVSILAITFSDEEVDGSLIQKQKRITLRSVDPLARRSAGETHFLRFGRSEEFAPGVNFVNERRINLRKREVISNFDGKGSDYLKTDNFEEVTTPPSKNALCLPPDGHKTDEQLTCFITGKNNSGNTFYVVTRDEDRNDDDDEDSDSDEGEQDLGQFVSNQTLSQLIYPGAINRLIDVMTRARRSKFSRNLFSRYDRGRDNFMRLGRSKIDFDDNENSEKILDWNKRKHDSFMRLGRNSKIDEDLYQRGLRNQRDNFMRLGRAPSKHDDFMRYGRGNIERYDRWSRKHDNFMRLGRSDSEWWKNLYPDKRDKLQNFIRLGRSEADDEGETRFRRMDNFVRFGRDHETKLPKKLTSFLRYGRSKNCDNENLRSAIRAYTRNHSDYNMAAVLTAANDCFRKYSNQNEENEFPRYGRGRDLILRFGKKSTESSNSERNSRNLNGSPIQNPLDIASYPLRESVSSSY